MDLHLLANLIDEETDRFAAQRALDRENKEGRAKELEQPAIFRAATGNVLFRGDHETVMQGLLDEDGMAGCFQCIYLDPPFFSQADYQATVTVSSETLRKKVSVKVPAYTDLWKDTAGEKRGENAYFRMLVRLALASRELLSETGLLWLHLDWHSVHYAKVILDAVFGPEYFINEVIWQYKSGGSSKRHFSRKHDTLLLYAKTADYRLDVGREKSYNRDLKPYHFQGVEEFQDDVGWYTMVNTKDVWEVDMVGRTAGERTGYATQKPLALMERIVAASSAEGDLVGDFCCGSGAFPLAAGLAGRRFVACDHGDLAIALTEKRLRENDVPYERWPLEEGMDAGRSFPEATLQHLVRVCREEDRAELCAIGAGDPDALVLFRTPHGDGDDRLVDVLGKMYIVPAKGGEETF